MLTLTHCNNMHRIIMSIYFLKILQLLNVIKAYEQMNYTFTKYTKGFNSVKLWNCSEIRNIDIMLYYTGIHCLKKYF